MDAELKHLKIDRSRKHSEDASPWARRWIIGGVLMFVVLGLASVTYQRLNAAVAVETARVAAPLSSGAVSQGDVVLNATGYVVAAHKIEVASKVVGRVAFIGVEKGDRVRKGDVLVRLEDEEYRAQLQQARGALANLEARLAELKNGSRPEEVAAAKANLEQAKAEMENARITRDRTRQLTREGIFTKQQLDDADAQYRAREARVNSLEKTYDLVRIGPRQEQIDAMQGQVLQARGAVQFAETQLENTVIRAPVPGTILERNVETGEFVTTGFVGDRGAKGYVVSLADLSDLEVELDISQSDFNKLSGPKQKASVNVDAYSDRKWDGAIYQIAPEADRQKATVQVKVKILNPDEYLRPEMNATVGFLSEAKPAAAGAAPAKAQVYVPAAAVKDGKVFVIVDGKAVARTVKTGTSTPNGLRVEQGLIGGEDIVVNPPSDLQDGTRVVAKSR